MKKTRFIICMGIIAMCWLPFLNANAQWTNVGSAGFSTNGVWETLLSFGSNDTPYVAFRDVGQGYKATVMKYNGSSWVVVGSAGFSAGVAENLSFEFDSNKIPYLSYRDVANSGKATVMKYNGSNWVTVGIAGFSDSGVSRTSIAFDSNDTPYVAYADGANNYYATVVKYNGSSWDTVGSAGFSPGIPHYASLAFDSNDVPYIGYTDFSTGASVMKYNGNSWVYVGAVGFSAGAAVGSNLSIDGNDTLYVAYKDGANSNKATVMKYNGSSWVNVGSIGFSAGTINNISMTIDNDNALHVAFIDGANSSHATVMKYNGSSWDTVGSTGFSAGSISSNDIKCDRNNNPYVVYRDNGNSSKATMMKYIFPYTWDGSTWSVGTPSSTDDATISSNTAPSSFTCKNLTINSGFALNTGTNVTATIHGDVTNNGNGVSGTGTLTFTKSGTATIEGDTIEHEGTILVETGCTLATSNKLRLQSNATNTGRIGNSVGTITGNVLVERYMPGKRCFRFYGHPFSSSIALNQLTDEIDITGSGGATNGFTPTTSNKPSAFYWDASLADTSTTGANPGWQAFTSATTASWDQYELLRLFVRGAKGEGLSGGSYTPSAATFEAAGTVNQGTQVVTLTKGANAEFVACGNPFPSPVEMDKVARGSNVGANYYAWDATSGASGAYVTNAWSLAYDLPAYAAFFTKVTANSNNTLTFEEADKVATSAALFKTTGPNDWVELYIYDSTTKWDRLLINLNSNGMSVEDKLDGKKLYNPNLDFFTVSQDDVRLAVDVRPYADTKSIQLGLTAYNRYNRYVIKTGMYEVPAGTKLYLHDKYLNKKEELKAGFEYWFDVTTDTLSQGRERFEINMVGKPTTGIIEATEQTAQMQLIPNPAYNEVKVSFDKIDGDAHIKLISVTGQVVYSKAISATTGSVTIPLSNIPAGIYIAELQSQNAHFTKKLIKE